MDDQTPWGDINPPMALAPQPERQTASSPSPLSPATSSQFRDELSACLSLVAPVGMTEDARAEWLAVAWNTLGHLPADLLRRGCQKARETCDHPSKIVPAILDDTRQQWAFRREHPPVTTPQLAGPRPPRPLGALMDARGKPMTDAETDTLNKHLEWIGSPARYQPDGSKQVTA